MNDTATSAPARSDACQWLTSCYRRHGQHLELTDPLARCVDTLTAISAIYNLQLLGGAVTPDTVQVTGRYISVLYAGDLSSYDNDSLTRLVLAAHRNAVRVQIAVWRPHLEEDRAERIGEAVAAEFDIASGGVDLSCTEIMLHPRDGAATRMYERHPSLADLAGMASAGR